MGKLHELLAVEPDLRSAYDQARARLISTFQGKSQWFNGQMRRYAPLAEEGEPFPDETEDITERVKEQLLSLVRSAMQYFDAVLQKERTNQAAVANLIVDGDVLVEGVPATVLLGLETKLRQVREVYREIPTLDPAERWELDGGLGVYRTGEKLTYRTKKLPRRFVKYEATAEHPAQVDVFTEDMRVGSWTTTRFSAMLPMTDKVELLKRCDDLIQAVKQARQRANDIEVRYEWIGQKLMDHINRSIVD